MFLKRLFNLVFRREPDWVRCEVRTRVNGQFFAVDYYNDGTQRLRELSGECQRIMQETPAYASFFPAMAHDDLLRAQARELRREAEAALARIQQGKAI